MIFFNYKQKFTLLLRKKCSPIWIQRQLGKIISRERVFWQSAWKHVNMEEVCKDFETKMLGECHGCYVQSETLFLANVFDRYIEINELDPAYFLSPPRLSW